MNVELISSNEQMGFTSVMLSSLRKSLPKSEKLNVFFVTGERKKTRQLERQLFDGDFFKTILIDSKKIFPFGAPSTIFYGDCLLRVFAPYFLPPSVDRILVLDGDTLVVGKTILSFYNFPFGENGIVIGSTGNSGAQDGICNRIGIKPGRSLNAGSLVLNVKEYVRSITLDDMILKVTELPFKPELVDQDIINYVFDSRKIILPNQTFNFWVGAVVDHSFPQPDFLPCVYHWPGPYKPWNSHTFLHKKYDKKWWHVAFRVLNPLWCFRIYFLKCAKYFFNHLKKAGVS